MSLNLNINNSSIGFGSKYTFNNIQEHSSAGFVERIIKPKINEIMGHKDDENACIDNEVIGYNDAVKTYFDFETRQLYVISGGADLASFRKLDLAGLSDKQTDKHRSEIYTDFMKDSTVINLKNNPGNFNKLNITRGEPSVGLQIDTEA